MSQFTDASMHHQPYWVHLKSVDPISVPNIYALRKYVFNVEILFIMIDSEEH